MNTDRRIQIVAWGSTAALTAITIAHWASLRLADGRLGPYELFPLLGLLAFTFMWFHYTINPVKIWMKGSDDALKHYYRITGWIVLALILLHPGIFVYTLWLDGFGLPPASYLSIYTDLIPRFALMLGSLSLIAFLAYELHRRFKDKKWWRWVEYANIAAMFAIFFHALTLGGEVADGWFRILWFAYAIILAAAIAYNYYYKQREEKQRA